MLPYRLPRPIRLAAYALATAILLYMCLAPSSGLPKVRMWDKEQHALAWFVLTATGLILSPRRPRAIALYAFGFGVLVEILQGLMGFGRDADWHDVAADSSASLRPIPYFLIVLVVFASRAPETRPADSKGP